MTTNVLILGTHNSARRVLGEGMLNALATRVGCDVRGCSAGRAPSGRINPFALEAPGNAGIDTQDFRSKRRDEFTQLPQETISNAELRRALNQIAQF